MEKELSIVFDCGSTNVRAVAVDAGGRIIASAGFPNSPSPQKGLKECLVWDMDRLWGRMSAACRKTVSQVRKDRIKAVTITTFGADGAPVDENGKLTYPAISWQCQRTATIAEQITTEARRHGEKHPSLDTGHWTLDTDITPEEIYRITGYQIISFNTILKLMWLRKNAPRALKKAKCWMMMPGLLSYRLCSEFSIDPTSGSTMMAMDIGRRNWSDAMLGKAGISREFFPEWVQPGEIIGKVTSAAARSTGIPEGTPVIAAGHDTQFALHGCGARNNEAVLSTGTWEILMLRADSCKPGRTGFEGGLIYECDAVPGYWNPQILMMGSAVIEWVRRNFYGNADYGIMISEGRKISPGSNGVTVIPSFKPDTGPFSKYGTPGTVLGLSLSTKRADIYRAAIEGLSFQLKSALQVLRSAISYQPSAIRVVGGGSKNDLWNQMRADVCGLPVVVTGQKEATVLGASMFAFKGAGVFSSVDEARNNYRSSEHTFTPSKSSTIYKQLFSKFRELPKKFSQF